MTSVGSGSEGDDLVVGLRGGISAIFNKCR